MTKGQIIDFSMPIPKTEFAPTYRFWGWAFQYDNEKNCDIMRNWVLNNKQRIIDAYNTENNVHINDGGTGLGKDTTTARYRLYNIWHETAEVPAFIDFRKRLYDEYCEFMEALKYSVKECTIQGWMNVMDAGEAIKVHNHGAIPQAYLSGNLHLDNYKTKTYYIRPIDKGVWHFTNVKGGCTIFPSQMMHGTDTHNELTGKRVSVAFDIYVKKFNLVKSVDGHEYPIVDFNAK